MRVPLGSLRWRSRLNLTASALTSVPSWNLMPLRSVITYTFGCGFSVFSTRLPTTAPLSSILYRLSQVRPMMALLYTSCDLTGSNVVGSRSMATVSWPPLTGLPAAVVAGWVGAAAAGAVVGFAAAAAAGCVGAAAAAGAVVGLGAAAAAAACVGAAATAGAVVGDGAAAGPHAATNTMAATASGKTNVRRESMASSLPVRGCVSDFSTAGPARRAAHRRALRRK